MDSESRNRSDRSRYSTPKKAEGESQSTPRKAPVARALIANKFTCWHCKMPFILSRNSKKLPLLHDGVIKRALCVQCEKRDNELASGVNQCLRLFGGNCSVAEIVAVYTDDKKARQLFKDPFSLVRRVYRGGDALTLRDIEGWIDDGVLRMSKDGTVTTPEGEIAKELRLRDAVREVREEMQETDRTSKIGDSESGSGSISRRSEAGGAATGSEFWEKMHGGND